MNKLTDSREIRSNILLLSICYLVSYLTRINFGAVIFDMVESTGYDKTIIGSTDIGTALLEAQRVALEKQKENGLYT